MINAFGERPHSTPIKTSPKLTRNSIVKGSERYKQNISNQRLAVINESLNLTGPKKKRVKFNMSSNQKVLNAAVVKHNNSNLQNSKRTRTNESLTLKLDHMSADVGNSKFSIKQKAIAITYATNVKQENEKQNQSHAVLKKAQNRNRPQIKNRNNLGNNRNCKPYSNQKYRNNNQNQQQPMLNHNAFNNNPNPNNNNNNYFNSISFEAQFIARQVVMNVHQNFNIHNKNLYVFGSNNNDPRERFQYDCHTNTNKNNNVRSSNNNNIYNNRNNYPYHEMHNNRNLPSNNANNYNPVYVPRLPHYTTYYNKFNLPYFNNYQFSSGDPQYNPYQDQNHFKNNGYLYSYQLIGDDFFLTLATMELHSNYNTKHRICQSGYCISGQTIRDVTHRVLNWPNLSKNVIVNIGSVDILHGHNLFEVIEDFKELLRAFEQRDIIPILTTLPPLANMAHNADVVMTLTKFNDYLRFTQDCVIDLWSCLVDNRSGRILYECYQT